MFGRDPEKPDAIIDTNQYLITHKGKGMLLDPGGVEVFPAMSAVITRHIRLSNLESLFASHQDPDIISSLAMWVVLCGHVKVYTSSIWETFISHFGGAESLAPVGDEGGTLPLGDSSDLRLIPAHYCHSSGNFSLYDPRARILFSGDLGAALLPRGTESIFVEDFDAHIPYMEGFHRRWMPSNQAKNNWVRRVRELDVNMLCPQHGAIFRGENVGRFLDWLEGLDVGVAA